MTTLADGAPVPPPLTAFGCVRILAELAAADYPRLDVFLQSFARTAAAEGWSSAGIDRVLQRHGYCLEGC